MSSGNNSSESAISMLTYLINFIQSRKVTELLYMDIDFRNMSDYIAQEYEIRKTNPTENEIEESKVMVEFRRLRLAALEAAQTYISDMPSTPRYRYVGDDYRAVISGLNFR